MDCNIKFEDYNYSMIWIGAFCLVAARNHASQFHVHRLCKEYTSVLVSVRSLWLKYMLNKPTAIITELLRYGSAIIIQSTNQHLGSRQNIDILCFRTHLKSPYFCSQNVHIHRTSISDEQDLETPNMNVMSRKVHELERSTFTYLHAYIDIETALQ